jgi:ribosome recycling factor
MYIGLHAAGWMKEQGERERGAVRAIRREKEKEIKREKEER